MTKVAGKNIIVKTAMAVTIELSLFAAAAISIETRLSLCAISM